MSKPETVLCAAVRTAIGTYHGTLENTPATALGAVAIKATLERAGLAGADVGTVVRVRIAARDVSLARSSAGESTILNRIPVTIEGFRGTDRGQVTVRLQIGSTFLLSRITQKSWDELQLAPGQQVVAQVKSLALLS